MIRCSLFTLVTATLLGLVPVYAQEQMHKEAYRLGAGDKVQVQVFNQPGLSGDYTVSGAGLVAMPLIGRMQAEGLSIVELTDLIISKLKPDYLVNPRVNVEMLNYRPFYIIGEVKRPGSFPYVEGMTYLNAVAIANGYTYRAKKKYAIVRRKGDPQDAERKVEMTGLVQPGDVIRIVERKF